MPKDTYETQTGLKKHYDQPALRIDEAGADEFVQEKLKTFLETKLDTIEDPDLRNRTEDHIRDQLGMEPIDRTAVVLAEPEPIG